MGKWPPEILIEGGKRMKISFKANIKFDLETQKKPIKKSSKNEPSGVKKVLTWLFLIVVEFFVGQILNKLVAWIIKIFTNGSFYFYNRMFYFEVIYR